MVIFGGKINEAKSALAKLLDGLEVMFLEDLETILDVPLIHK